MSDNQASENGIPLYANVGDTLLPVIEAGLLPGGEIRIEDSPTYRWSGATMRQRIGEVVPLVYGRHVVAPTLINAYIEEGEYETLNMLLAWCEGPIESVTNIKVNGNQIENLYLNQNPNDSYGDGAEITVRTGEINQDAIQNFHELHNITGTSEFLYQDQPFVFDGTITDAEAFRLEFEMDKLYQKDDQGNILSWYFAVQVEIKGETDGDFHTLGIIEHNKKSTTTFKRYFKTEYMTPGRYKLRIKKVSENAEVGVGAKTFGVLRLISVDEIRTEALEYPGVAVTGIRLISFQDLQGTVPNITGMVTGRKVRMPKVTFDFAGTQPVDWEQYYYDGNTATFKRLGTNAVLYWDGVTYHDQWGGNPVWCLRDLLLSKRYGLGDFVEEAIINDPSFLASALYCEEAVENDEGENEKRGVLDLVLDSSQSAPDVLATITRTFRGLLFQSEGQLRLSIEKAETPKALFNMGNICSDSFSMQYLPKKAPNVLSVTFTNRDKNYLRDSFEVGTNEQQLQDQTADVQGFSLIGVTRLTQVLRDARVYLNKLNNNTRVINFSAYFDSVLLQPFDVVEFQHDVPGWGAGGRVTEFCTTLCVNLDAETFIEPGKTYKLKIRNPNTDAIEERTVTDIPGVYRSLNVSPAFSFIPQENDLWSLGSDDDEGTQLYRLVNIQKTTDGRVNFQAIENNNDVYDPTAVIVPQEIYTHLVLDIPKVQNLSLQELTNKLPNGTFESRIQVSWKLPPKSAKYVKQAREYEIWSSDNDGASWQLVGKTDREYFINPETITAGKSYKVAVVSVAETGEKNPLGTSPQQSITIQGGVSSPSQVQNLDASFTDEIILTWDKNPEADIQAYEIRTADTGWLSNDADFVWRGQANRFVVVRPTQREGIVYYIRAINTTGMMSDISKTVEPKNPRPPAPNLLSTTLFEKVFLSWLPLSDQDLLYYEIWQNSEPVFFGIDFRGSETLMSNEPGTTFVASVPFPVTYYRICGVDRFGRGAFSNIIRAEQVQVEAGGIAPRAILATHITDDAIETRHITAGSIVSGKIAAKAIVADNIDVADLSAISANLGTVRSGKIIGALIKTSEDLFRLEMDSQGLRAYNSGGLQTFDLSQGSLKFLDPDDPNTFTCMDAGGMVMQTPYETVPYATRICAGVACAGSHVQLARWKSRPELQLGIKRLRSYDTTRSESSQEWCVYADNLSYYDFGGSNFGWGFDVRAKLVISGGSRAEQIFNTNFNVIRCTGTVVCQVQIGLCFQVWCHQAAPDPVCYAKICYAINYRLVGASLFCHSDFLWTQPNLTCNAIKQTYKLCHTLDFGQCGTWEVCMSECSREYIASPYDSGAYILSPVTTRTVVDKSYMASVTISGQSFGGSVGLSARGTNLSDRYSEDVVIDFPYWSQPQTIVCSTVVNWNARASATAFVDHPASHAAAQVVNKMGGASVSKTGVWPERVSWSTSACISGSAGYGDYQTRVVAARVQAFLQVGWHSGISNAGASISGGAQQVVTFKCIKEDVTLDTQFVKVFVGNAASQNTRLFSSMRDVTGQETVLDPGGEINYLAIAYR